MMITVQQARELIQRVVKPAAEERLGLSELSGRVLARDLHSPLDLPPFRQSSMDGYALRLAEDAQPELMAYQEAGMTPAGQAPGPALLPGQARRVFTGAALPEGTELVIKQEDRMDETDLRFKPEAFQKGRFVREAGSAVKRGDPVLQRGDVLHAGAMSLLASCGMDAAWVYARPRVSIITSGDELVAPGSQLKPGQIYESNTWALSAAVWECTGARARIRQLPDEEDSISAAIEEELAQCDMLLLCGGISVGEFDFSGRALRRAGVEELFYRVAQKPGMPLFFGRKSGGAGAETASGVGAAAGAESASGVGAAQAASPAKLVFALPGNPASALVCFWVYARSALRMRMGYLQPELPSLELPLAADLHKRAGRAAFERARVERGQVFSLEGQDSYQLNSLARANALLVLPEEERSYQAGDRVQVMLLPGMELSGLHFR